MAGFLLCAGGRLHAQAPRPALPPGDGRDLVAVACTQCHGLAMITTLRDGPAGWKYTVQEMVLRGAQLLPEEADTVVQYLSKNFGPGTSPMQSGVKGPPLPEGAGKQLVETRCTLCHDLGKVTAAARSKEEWDRIVKNMAARGLTARPEEINTITSYLTAQFGKKAE